MSTIFFDSPITDELRRTYLYRGDIFVFSPSPSALALCALARELSTTAFAPLDPRTAQFHLPVEEYAAILTSLKPQFIHHPKAKELIQGILKELNCDLTTTYFDVPRLRTSTSNDYLTTGIAYAWHPHRDTWYSAPACQVNWWMPVYEIEPENGMAFHSRYWAHPVRNDSQKYNYYQWNQHHRASAAQHLKEDPRPLPRPTEPLELDPQLRPLGPVGGLIAFSAAQLHSTVPNTTGKTRFSIDFRTVHLDDVQAQRGAANIDSACTGTSLRDFLRATDLAQIPPEVVAIYADGTESSGTLHYSPSSPRPH